MTRTPARDRAVVVLALALALAVAAIGCRKPPALTRNSVVELITQSEAFRGPWDPGIVFVDHGGGAPVSQNAKRELLSLEGMTVKEDGPFGWSGSSTAKVAFTWHWNGGPLGNVVYHSTAKLHFAGEQWRVYDEMLRDDLWRAERGVE